MIDKIILIGFQNCGHFESKMLDLFLIAGAKSDIDLVPFTD